MWGLCSCLTALKYILFYPLNTKFSIELFVFSLSKHICEEEGVKYVLNANLGSCGCYLRCRKNRTAYPNTEAKPVSKSSAICNHKPSEGNSGIKQGVDLTFKIIFWLQQHLESYFPSQRWLVVLCAAFTGSGKNHHMFDGPLSCLFMFPRAGWPTGLTFSWAIL
jgi:hypothetical protein